MTKSQTQECWGSYQKQGMDFPLEFCTGKAALIDFGLLASGILRINLFCFMPSNLQSFVIAASENAQSSLISFYFSSAPLHQTLLFFLKHTLHFFNTFF